MHLSSTKRQDVHCIITNIILWEIKAWKDRLSALPLCWVWDYRNHMFLWTLSFHILPSIMAPTNHSIANKFRNLLPVYVHLLWIHIHIPRLLITKNAQRFSSAVHYFNWIIWVMSELWIYFLCLTVTSERVDSYFCWSVTWSSDLYRCWIITDLLPPFFSRSCSL